jgi:hypothetical protein
MPSKLAQNIAVNSTAQDIAYTKLDVNPDSVVQ